MRRWLAAAVLAVALAAAGWFGWRAWQARRDAGAERTVVQDIPGETAPAPETIETVTAADAPPALVPGATPMRARIATLGLLNKRNGRARDLTLRPGQMIRVGDVAIHLRACDRTAPWEPDQLTGAFVQVDVRGADRRWRRPFSGWLFRERPNLNVVQHPVYDVWTKSCAMSFPATGPDTETLRAPIASSARKSPAPAAPTAPASASPSNDR